MEDLEIQLMCLLAPSVKIANAHITATAKMIADIQPIAQKFIDEVNADKTRC